MPNQPTGQQLEQFTNALLKAFDHDELTRLVRSQFDQSLEWITPVAGKRDLTTFTADLVVYFASQEGGLKKLLAAAIRENPLSPDLIPIAMEWSAIEFAPLPLPSDHPHVIEKTVVHGDQIGGDKIGGDVVHGNKIVYQNASPLDLSELEQAYLKGLYADCNELLLANDGPVDHGSKKQPRMQHVYVDLETDVSPTVKIIWQRILSLNENPSELFGRLNQIPDNTIFKGKIGRSSTITTGQLTVGPNDEHISINEAFLDQFDSESTNELAKQLEYSPQILDKIFTRLTVLEAIRDNKQLVILGDPGSGKSTLTRRLAGVFASADRTDMDETEAQWLAELDAVFGRRLMPIRIVMSRWAANLAEDATGGAAALVSECLRIQRQTADLSGHSQEEHFAARLTGDEPTALILLDGLDEASDPARRAKLLAAVRNFCNSFKNVPLIVTCRIRPYEAWTHSGEALALPAFTLAGLSRGEIGSFIDRWHAELIHADRYQPTDSKMAKERLLTAIDDPNRKELRQMAKTPLLLTMMARVNYSKGLPNSRAMLYEEYVRQLLWEWEKKKLDDRGQATNLEKMLQSANVSTGSLENALNRLAYTVHNPTDDSEQTQDTVDIPRLVVRDALEGIHPGEASAKAAWAVEMLELINDRSGLLYSTDDNTCHFSHRTFQEYLAARWMASGKFLTKFKEKIDDEAWREAIFLALGFQISVHPPAYDDALDVFWELLPEEPKTENDWRRILLLGDAYVHLFGSQRAREAEQTRKANDLIKEIPDLLTQTMQNPTLPPTQRLEAGKLLADLDIDPPDLDAFVTIPGQPFRIGKYPVTNRQFGRFIEAGGYQNDEWWQDEYGRDYRDESGRDYQDEDKWDEPYLIHDSRYNWCSQLIVSMSWYEANAYCKWLTNNLRSKQEISKNEMVRLPTQSEWTAAAHSYEADYPWGQNEFDMANANTEESEFGHPSPVHMYYAGKTNDGVWDLSGNVWEWTNDNDEHIDYFVKGGSWRSEANNAKSSFYLVYPSVHLLHNIGFRVLIAPIPLDSI